MDSIKTEVGQRLMRAIGVDEKILKISSRQRQIDRDEFWMESKALEELQTGMPYFVQVGG